MGGSLDDLSEDLAAHGLVAHGVDVLAAAVVVEVVEAMRIGEASPEHSECLSPRIHVVDELLCVKFDAFKVLSKVDASNL